MNIGKRNIECMKCKNCKCKKEEKPITKDEVNVVLLSGLAYFIISIIALLFFAFGKMNLIVLIIILSTLIPLSLTMTLYGVLYYCGYKIEKEFKKYLGDEE